MQQTYRSVDQAYSDLLEKILQDGDRKENRTGVDTISLFGQSIRIDISQKFPLLTLKDMSGGIFESVKAELIWYLSGEHHIRNLQEHTQIWNEWADEEGNLDFAYGRFWRRYPIPGMRDHLPGETWPKGHPDKNKEVLEKYVKEEGRETSWGDQRVWVFDQIQYILDKLQNDPFSRRMVLNAWHPANAAAANPPACHCMAMFNVGPDGETLNCQLNMRSSDVFIGLPFNIAQYSMLTYILAQEVGMSPGTLFYTGADVHLYVGDDKETEEYDQIDVARKVLERDPKKCDPQLEISQKPIDQLGVDDIKLKDYEAHPYIGTKTVP